MEKEKITIETIDKLAQLSKLEFNPDEKNQMLSEVSGIIEMLDQCGNINVDLVGVKEIKTIEDLREDIVEASLDNEAALRNAPMSKSGYLGVPKVVQ